MRDEVRVAGRHHLNRVRVIRVDTAELDALAAVCLVNRAQILCIESFDGVTSELGGEGALRPKQVSSQKVTQCAFKARLTAGMLKRYGAACGSACEAILNRSKWQCERVTGGETPRPRPHRPL